MSDAEGSEMLDVHARPFAIAVDADGIVQAKRMLNTIPQLAELTASIVPVSAPVGGAS
jgi:hypothetical protein